MEIDEDGYWVIGGNKTDVLAKGVKGDDGKNGSDGKAGSDGKNGSDGLSAYDIYCKYYDYDGTEKDWIDDLVAGRLSGENYFTVQLVCYKGTYILKTLENATIDLTDVDYSREGYVLSGWTRNGAPFDPATPITASVVLTAVYQAEGIEEFTEETFDLGTPVSVTAGSRKRITVPEEIFGYYDSLRFEWSAGEVDLVVYSVIDGQNLYENTLSAGEDYVLALSDYEAYGQAGNGGIVLDLTFRAPDGSIVVTPETE